MTNNGESVATMWGRMVADAEQGIVVTIANKHGRDVAVMVGIEQWTELNWDLLSRCNVDMSLPRPSGYVVGMTWDEVPWDE